jgi:hypothetical protein
MERRKSARIANKQSQASSSRASPPRATSPVVAAAPMASSSRASSPRATSPVVATAPMASSLRASSSRATSPVVAAAPMASSLRASSPRASSPRASLLAIVNNFVPTDKVGIFTFGRYQPPHNGHKIVIDTIIEIQNMIQSKYIVAQHFIFPSHTYKFAKNSRYPLKIENKIQYMNKMFPYANIIYSSCKTIYDIKMFLKSQGFTKLLMVVGSDQVNAFKKCMTEDNGEYVVCAGNQRIADLTSIDNEASAEELSATLLRKYATDENFNEFKKHVMIGDVNQDIAFNLMNDVREGLKLSKLNRQQSAGKKQSKIKKERRKENQCKSLMIYVS